MDNYTKALRELGQYLGIKIDTLIATSRAPVRVDIGESSKALEKAAASVEKASTSLDKLSKSNDLGITQKSLISLAASISAMSKAVGSVKPTDMSETNRRLSDLGKQIGKLKLNVPPTDMSKFDDVIIALAQVREAVSGRPEENDRTDEVIKAIKGLKLQLPESLKLDASQLAQIRLSGGGGGATASYARKGITTNVAMATADTEYSHTFSPNTIGFRIRVRDNAVPLLYSWQSGVLPTSGTGTAYSTLQAYSELVRDGLDVGNKTLYLQTGSDSQVVEIEEFTLQ